WKDCRSDFRKQWLGFIVVVVEKISYIAIAFSIGRPFELEKDLLPIMHRNLRIVSSGVKSSSQWLPVRESATRIPKPLVVRFSTKLGQRLDLVKLKPTFSLSTKAFPPRTPENTPHAYVVSTSANPDPTINPTFVEANYEVLEYLLRERKRQMRNEDLRTELKYFSEEYDEEREIEPRPARAKETTLVLRAGSQRVRRQRERVVEFEDAPNMDESMAPTSNHDPAHKGLMYPLAAPSNNYPFYTQLIYSLPNAPAYPNHGPTGLFIDSTGCITPFVCWIEDYPFPNRLKMLSHVGFYDGKGDPDNYLHLFKGSILNYEDLKVKFRSHFSQQKKFTKTHLAVHNIKHRAGESTRAFVTRYMDDTLEILGLRKEQRISGFVHGLKTRSLVEFLSMDLPITYKGLMEKTYTWIEAKEVATNGAPNDHRESFNIFKKKLFWGQQ
nr:hypothetical protein [Tanacetum cinerariifolium]